MPSNLTKSFPKNAKNKYPKVLTNNQMLAIQKLTLHYHSTIKSVLG